MGLLQRILEALCEVFPNLIAMFNYSEENYPLASVGVLPVLVAWRYEIRFISHTVGSHVTGRRACYLFPFEIVMCSM